MKEKRTITGEFLGQTTEFRCRHIQLNKREIATLRATEKILTKITDEHFDNPDSDRRLPLVSAWGTLFDIISNGGVVVLDGQQLDADGTLHGGSAK